MSTTFIEQGRKIIKSLGILKDFETFRHGIHPGEFKDLTKDLPIKRMPFVDEYLLPLSQHLGSPSVAVVKKNQKVKRGELIAKAGGFVSANLHAPVTGTVKSIGKHNHPSGKVVDTIIIKRDPLSPQTLYNEGAQDWQSLSGPELLAKIAEGGFVGLGGAAFPTHVKMSVPEGKKARFFIINASECEPFLTTDHRIMLEYPELIYLGIEICQKILESEITYIGIEANKPDAISPFKQPDVAIIPSA